ncbi:MAG: response regulator [Deltaproteobacteria bacterium]|nr:response regulator [Deltaproteobacteria bacterium]MBN2686599.1 response regulator [Deltaproteobacteria bacterium]
MDRRILVVDDEIHVVRLLQKYLASKSYEVYTATDGAEALQMVKDVRPHIVLLDIIMPGIGGIETLKEIKKINPETAVIMITAVVDEELANRSLKLGADDYIPKPIDLEYIDTVLLLKSIDLLSLRDNG